MVSRFAARSPPAADERQCCTRRRASRSRQKTAGPSMRQPAPLASALPVRRRIKLPRLADIGFTGGSIALNLLGQSAQEIGVRKIGVEPDRRIKVGNGAVE